MWLFDAVERRNEFLILVTLGSGARMDPIQSTTPTVLKGFFRTLYTDFGKK